MFLKKCQEFLFNEYCHGEHEPKSPAQELSGILAKLGIEKRFFKCSENIRFWKKASKKPDFHGANFGHSKSLF